MYSPTEGSDERLDALFRAYRDACPVPEPSANFMPELWQRIEARRSFTFSLRRMTGAFVTAALAFTLAMSAFMFLPRSHVSSAFYSQSYVEALAAAQGLDPDAPEAARVEMGEQSPTY